MTEKLDRSVPLPDRMQGRWIGLDDPDEVLVVAVGEVIYRDVALDYDVKTIDVIDDALTVSLAVSDPRREDSFASENITDLVITPEGEFHAYNTRFASQFERSDSV